MNETALTQISDHVYWMPPAQPYYPSLCAVVGDQKTLMLDAGADKAHAQRFLEAMKAKGVRPPDYVALTHWHFDHIMGASVIGVPVIAHTDTAEKIAALARYDLNDPGHAEQKAAGNHIANTAEYIRDQLADPQGARITEPTLIVHDRFEIRLGGVTCQMQHVGGDHADDSCAIYLEPDRVLFMGDSLYNGFIPVAHYTVKRVFPLLDALLAFDAESFIQGHTDKVETRAEIETLAGIIRRVGTLVQQPGADEASVLAAAQAQTGQAPDEESLYFTGVFLAGRAFE